MFDQSLLKKPQTGWTEEEKSKVNEATKSFTEEIDKVCKAHGMAHRAIIEYTKHGLVPALEVVALEPSQESEPKE